MDLNISYSEIVNISILGNVLTTINENGEKKEYHIPRMTRLICSGNRLATLPTLPERLKYLDCSVNQLAALPKLPKRLRFLDCSGK